MLTHIPCTRQAFMPALHCKLTLARNAGTSFPTISRLNYLNNPERALHATLNSAFRIPHSALKAIPAPAVQGRAEFICL